MQGMIPGYWYYGFHCCHVGDYIPGMIYAPREIQKIYRREIPADFFFSFFEMKSEFRDTYKDIAYVKRLIGYLTHRCNEYKNVV